MRSSLYSLAAGLSTALAQYKGFNYGSTNTAGAPYTLQDYTNLFNNAAALSGAPGFTSARLYTMIQAGYTDTVTSAIPAAINTGTTLLLGMWASAGSAAFQNEITALKNAIIQFPQLKIAGISVGSEDLYRISPSAAQAGSTNPGAQPAELVTYIQQVRNTLAGTAWSGVKVGHVDTWTAYANSTNDIVANAIDFAGIDAYPYFQNVNSNGIENGLSLFQTALNSITPAAKAKEIWVTETGWPVSGPTDGLAVPSLANAETYWQAVGCNFLFGKYNTWWYTFDDAGSSPSFGVSTGGTTPLYNLACSSSTSSASTTRSTPASSVGTASIVGSTASTTIPVPTPGSALGTQTSAATSAAAPSASASAASSGVAVTKTVGSTVYVTATSCPPSASTLITVTKTASTASSAAASPSSSGCPADLNGSYQYPHLIVPISSTSPNTAYGTQYNGTITPTISSIFNFDIPAEYAGKTCSLIFLLPLQSQLQTSAFTFNNQGGITSQLLSSVADQGTTYANVPKPLLTNGGVTTVQAGNSYVISSDKCPAGTRVSFEISSTNGLNLSYFQDYNPSPIGLYVRAC